MPVTTKAPTARPQDDPAWRRRMALQLDYNAMMAESVGSQVGFTSASLDGLSSQLKDAYRQIADGSGKGAEYLGFLALCDPSESAVARIEKEANRLAAMGDKHIILGIGGSYLGARALEGALCDPYRNERGRSERGGRPKLLYEGNNLDPEAMRALLTLLPSGRPNRIEEDFTVNVISKSGGTIETAVAFRVLRQRLQQVYGSDYASRVVATTDASKGLLRRLAADEGYETFVIPDDVGGRYSVLTPVGLLPGAVAGVDIRALLAGAKDMAKRCQDSDFRRNPAYLHAALQHLSYKAGRGTSVMVAWGKALEGVAMWYDQLCAESLGKENKGRVPISTVNTRDLHSRGQELQQGPRNVVVTNLAIDRFPRDLVVLSDPGDRDGLDYVAGKSVGQMLRGAREATTFAYSRDRRPSMTFRFPELNAYTLGQFFYVMEVSTVVEGYLMGINPLDQPGVEDYKKFMFGILGKRDMAQWKEEFDRRPKPKDTYVI